MKSFLIGAARPSDFISPGRPVNHSFANIKTHVTRVTDLSRCASYKCTVVRRARRGKGDRLVSGEKVYIRFRTVSDGDAGQASGSLRDRVNGPADLFLIPLAEATASKAFAIPDRQTNLFSNVGVKCVISYSHRAQF